jgi:hypothetical protein
VIPATPTGARCLGSSRLQVRERIRRVVDYCAKLGRRHRIADDVDLFTVLPTTSRQEGYA